MKLAVTGTTGRVGRALSDHFAACGATVLELPRSVYDLADPELANRLRDLDFDVLLNPAAMTSLEGCEDEPELAARVNAVSPGMLAAMCRGTGRRMLHFSTDYVLSGTEPGLRDESAAVDPVSEYARSKLDGERAVLGQGGCVVRVSWVFGPERAAFPDQVIRRALAGEPLAAIADKTSLPVSTRDLCGWVGKLIEAGLPNEVIHACNGGEPVSWFGMADEIVTCLCERGVLERRPEIARLRLAEMEMFRAVRPRHTEMATGRLTALTGVRPRDWREALREHVAARLISR